MNSVQNQIGISSLLNEKCRVYYCHLYSTRQLGRVSDLISACFEQIAMDDLRLRTLLLYLIYDAHLVANESIRLECGVDQEKIAIGILIFTPQMDYEGLKKRILSDQPEGVFENLLCSIKRSSKRVIIRAQPKTGKMEIISMFSISDASVDALGSTPSGTLDFYSLEENPPSTTQTGEYIELGDVDYAQLLEDGFFSKRSEAPLSGNILVSSDQEDLKNQEVTRVQGGGLDAEALFRVQGHEKKSLFNLMGKALKFWKKHDGMMSDLIAEKSKLNNYTKEVNLAIRQKELEFKRREQGLEVELKKREEIIRQRNYALSRLRQQMHLLNSSYEKLKSENQDTDGALVIRQKYNRLQKAMTLLREQNSQLNSSIEELRAQLFSVQNNSQEKALESEISILQNRLVQSQDQINKYKKANQQLTEKLATLLQESRSSLQASGVEDLRKQLETSSKAIAIHKKEIERLCMKNEDLQKEKLILKVELSRVMAELDKFKAERAKSAA